MPIFLCNQAKCLVDVQTASVDNVYRLTHNSKTLAHQMATQTLTVPPNTCAFEK